MRDLKGWLLEFYQGSRASWVRLIFVMNMSNCNYIEKKKIRHKHRGIMSARFLYPLSFCHKNRKCFNLTDRSKIRLTHDRNHRGHFVYSLSQAHCISRYHFSLSVMQPPYSDFISLALVLTCISRHTFLGNPLLCSVQQEEKMPEFLGEIWGWAENGHKQSRRSAKSRRLDRVSALSL